MKRTILGLAVVLAMATAASAQSVNTRETSLGNILTDERGMTLYIFDRDTAGATASACSGNCINNWPPFLAAADAAAHDEWTLVDVEYQGAMQKMWAYQGLPLYYWMADQNPGDTSGDGVGGVWHVVRVQ
jgi:predicted lipoprotein with Yx(FWY)xxD motif